MFNDLKFENLLKDIENQNFSNIELFLRLASPEEKKKLREHILNLSKEEKDSLRKKINLFSEHVSNNILSSLNEKKEKEKMDKKDIPKEVQEAISTIMQILEFLDSSEAEIISEQAIPNLLKNILSKLLPAYITIMEEGEQFKETYHKHQLLTVNRESEILSTFAKKLQEDLPSEIQNEIGSLVKMKYQSLKNKESVEINKLTKNLTETTNKIAEDLKKENSKESSAKKTLEDFIRNRQNKDY